MCIDPQLKTELREQAEEKVVISPSTSKGSSSGRFLLQRKALGTKRRLGNRVLLI